MERVAAMIQTGGPIAGVAVALALIGLAIALPALVWLVWTFFTDDYPWRAPW
ncbi:MAG TPA: hypothetical protein VF151_11010 [Gemmatimonadales bacterium]